MAGGWSSGIFARGCAPQFRGRPEGSGCQPESGDRSRSRDSSSSAGGRMDMETIRRGAAGVGALVYEASPADREEICEMLTVCNAFTQEEVRVALEVLDAGLAGGLEGDYPVFVAKADGEVRGYA